MIKYECFILFLLPLFEFGVDDSAGESFTTNSDTLKYTVTLELVEYKSGIDHAGLFQLVGDDTTHKMRMCAVQVLHQFVQGFLIQNNMKKLQLIISIPKIHITFKSVKCPFYVLFFIFIF